MKAMNCVYKGSPEAFQLIHTAIPSINDHEVLVKISAALVTASDCITGSGSSALAGFFGSRKKSKENIMGVEFAGVVSAVGNQVNRFKVNDCVFGSAGLSYGAYAEYLS